MVHNNSYLPLRPDCQDFKRSPAPRPDLGKAGVLQLQRGGVMVSMVESAAVRLEADLAELDLAFLVNDRDRALAARLTEARNAAT